MSNTIFKITIPSLKLVELDTRKIKLSGDQSNFFTKHNDDFPIKNFLHFPILLNSNRTQWKHANLYLLSKTQSLPISSYKTLDSIAHDLMSFKEHLDKEEIDYLTFPKRKFRRPTYFYRISLQEQIEQGKISRNTASRKMSSVIGFYRWLSQQHDIYFEHSPWDEKDSYISYQDSVGFYHSKKISTTDLKVSSPGSQDYLSQHIRDGGKLRPLNKKEQLILISALKSSDNPEMMLSFIIALTTGARMQTVFTLRRDIVNFDTSGKSNIAVPVGVGTDVDTKYGKRMNLVFPSWLIERLKIYDRSFRAKRRRSLSKHQFKSADQQYLFLTRSGKPYYIAENDPLRDQYRYPPSGNAIREFIKSHIQPALIKAGLDLNPTFHDLRATYGMNLLSMHLTLIEEGKSNLLTALTIVRERMGHNHLQTTEAYLNYYKQSDIAINAQSEFEAYLEDMIEVGHGD